MRIKTLILLFSLLFLPMVAAAQSQIQVPQPKPNSKSQATSKLHYNSSTGELVYGNHRYKMVYVEGGSFNMGATSEQANPWDREKPVHRVTLSRYRIGQTEVPQWLWVAVMGNNPSEWKGDNLPVENVSWEDCQEFLWKLNKQIGQNFTLPTEAQWEFAARGGNKSRGYQYSGSYAIGVVAWYEGNSGGRTHDVGLKEPNELGLYDMSGNVWEWCNDWLGTYPDSGVTNPKGASSGSNRVNRGGSWVLSPSVCRVAVRGGFSSDDRSRDTGFRLALEAKANQPQPQPALAAPKLTYNSSTGELVYGTHRYKMVYVEGGSFDMGVTPEQEVPYGNEKPVHRVTLSGYRIGQTEVPQWLWVAVMGNNPSAWKGDNLPVERVSWDDCQEFLGKLNNIMGQFFMLPTEAQWEFAARGGNRSRGFQYSGSDGLGAVAWYEDNSGKRTHEVGLQGPNELGLYDMSGNVFEWCNDWFGDYPNYSVTNPKGASSGSNRVHRGGSWLHSPWYCRVAVRGYYSSDFRFNYLGFRLALEAKAPQSQPQPAPAAPKLTYNSSTGELVYGTHRYKMVYVEGGSFDMGSTSEQVNPSSDEKPVHRVTLSGYRIGQTEVPQWLWVAVMGNNPSAWKGDNLPVEMVSWDDCQEFLGKLNNITGQFFMLPTEAQWEFAARGGNRSRGFQYSGSDGLGAVAWYEDNSGRRTHEVGLKGPNELGLYDMSGNVFEWCNDWFGTYPDSSVTNPKGASSGGGRVNRGGSWSFSPRNCRVANRSVLTPDYRSSDLGFRLVLSS